MKIAVVEKNSPPYDPYKEYFNFKYDRFELTKSKNSKILKRDITLTETFEDYDYVILIGKEPCRFIGKVSNVLKYSGHIVNDKYIPLVNPIAVKFNPGIKNTLDGALTKLHNHISGDYKEVLGKYEGIQDSNIAKNWLLHLLNNKKLKNVVVDIETSSLYNREGYVLGIAMSHTVRSGVYIDSECITEEVAHLMQKVFKEKTVIFHNAKFDMNWLRFHFDFEFYKWHDTMLQHYLLNENEPHDLKYLCMKYTEMGEYDFELEEFKKSYMKAHGIKKADFSYEVIPFDTMYKYAAGDADGTLRLFNKFNPIIQKNFKKLYESIMIEGTKFLADIEETGVPFSKEYLEKANISLTNEILELNESLYKYPEIHAVEKDQGVKFNPNSTAQLAKLFFDKLNLPVIKETPKGAPSTDKEVLAELAGMHEIPKIISDIRELAKIRSTYITKVLRGIDYDGRLRAGFHLHTVTSGRLSSSGKLNMQQLPARNKTVKDCIRPSDPDYVIFSQDLTTAEMYYAAVLSGDKNLAKVFMLDEGDFHSSIAKLTFNLSCDVKEIPEKYPHLRQASKAISFGILYGAGAAKVAAQAGISIGEAKNIIKQYFDQFFRLKEWLDSTQQEILSTGYIYSMFGRKRRVPSVFSLDDYEQAHAMRSAVNFTIQSVASDVNLLSAIDTHKEFRAKKVPANIFALVHDSIVGECHKDEVETVRKILQVNTQKDRGVSIPQCPIGIDFGYGESYAAAG